MNRLRRRLVRGGDAERGSLAIMVAVMGVGLFALGGLVIDSARQLHARSRALGYAEEAARAGSGMIDLDNVGIGRDEVHLDPALAKDQAFRYCETAQAADPAISSCCPTYVDENWTEVRVETTIPTGLLGLIGIQTMTAGGNGQARAVAGVDQATTPQPPDPPQVTTCLRR